MKKKKDPEKKSRYLLVIITILCISAMALTASDVVNIEPLRQAAGVVLLPFQNGISRIGGAFSGVSQSRRDAAELAEENERLQNRVDALEEENPGCFDDSSATFADLYMKSGLYIAEIVTRLYNSETIKAAYPDDTERLRHIFTEQVYGMAPTSIIYHICLNFILGFDDGLRELTGNFVLADAAEAAKAGTLQELVDEHFG